jgi:hypothetical protein
VGPHAQVSQRAARPLAGARARSPTKTRAFGSYGCQFALSSADGEMAAWQCGDSLLAVGQGVRNGVLEAERSPFA